jgi:hypothetical protein
MVIAAGTGVAITPVINGWQAEATWRDAAPRVSDALSASLGGQARVEVIDYQRGLYRARVTSRIELPAPALTGNGSAPIELIADHRLRHGWRGVSIDGHLEPVGALADSFRRLGGDETTLSMDGEFGHDAQSLQIRSESLAGPLDRSDTVTLEIAPLALEARTTEAGDHWVTALDWSGFALREPDTEAMLSLGGLKLDSDLRLVAGQPLQGVWAGEVTLGLEEGVLRPDTGKAMTLARVDLTTQSHVSDASLLDGDMTLDWQGLSLPRLAGLRGRIGVAFERLAPQALLRLSEQAASGHQSRVSESEWRQTLAAMAAEGPRARVSSLRVESAAGAGLTGSAELRIKPDMAAQLRAGADAMALWQSLRLDASLGVDTALVEALPAEQRLWVEQARAFGVLRRTDDGWDATMSIDDGSLSVNGESGWWGPGG